LLNMMKIATLAAAVLGAVLLNPGAASAGSVGPSISSHSMGHGSVRMQTPQLQLTNTPKIDVKPRIHLGRRAQRSLGRIILHGPKHGPSASD
jgi:hypothetical protein